jgi:GH15 family glucan-1,4-alpha-glucosidase
LAIQGDGAFAICSFWLVHYLAIGGGTLREAKEAFEAMLAFAPQGFTHLGLINAALSLQRREQGALRLQRDGVSLVST